MNRRTVEPAPTALPLDSIRVGKRFRQNMGDIAGLAASIAEHGLLHPVVVTPERDLIAGERRLLAVRSLGWAEVPVTVIAPRDLLRAEAAENRDRQDFTPSEAVAMAERLRPVVAAPIGRPEKSAQIAPTSKPDRTRDRVAAAVGMSSRTLEKAEAVVAAVEADPELAPIADEMDRTGNVDGAFQKLRKAKPDPVLAFRAERMAADPDIRLAELRSRWSKVAVRLSELVLADPAEYVPHLDRDDLELLPGLIASTRRWLDRIEAQATDVSRPRLVGGGTA